MSITQISLQFVKIVCWIAGLAFLGAIFSWHLSTLHENSNFFSHLSSFERELTFRSELGLYYSYFKEVIEAASFNEGISSLLNDNKTEYPNSINVLRRFNLYPEIFLAAVYRNLMHYAEQFNVQTKECFTVSRGNSPDSSAVLSCVGWGEPAEFYVKAVFIWNGIVPVALFLIASTLSDSLLGGVFCVTALAFNNEEATRVQWGAQLRESFAYPFFLLQLLAFTRFLVSVPARKSPFRFAVFTLLTTAFLSTWQFAQFVCATQLAIGVLLRILRLFDDRTYSFLARAHATAFLLSFLLLFANRLMVTSLYFSVIVAALALLVFDARSAIGRVAICFASLLLSKLVSRAIGAEDDGHIWEILLSKLHPSYRTFDSQLYTCAEVFDWINVAAILKISRTLLLPTAAVSALCVTFCCLVHSFRIWFPPKSSRPIPKPLPMEGPGRKTGISLTLRRRIVPNAPIVYDVKEPEEVRNPGTAGRESVSDPFDPYIAALSYHLLQLLVFTLLAVLVMRLKLLCVPHLCVFAGLITSSRLVQKCNVTLMRNEAAKIVKVAVLTSLFIGMALQGVPNLRAQHAQEGEFYDVATESVLSWIASNTAPNATFAASMPFSATIKLTLGRPIVCHPHYEDAGLRLRVRAVYSLTSRKPLADVYRALRTYGVDFVAIEKHWCLGNARREGCSQAEIWDVEDVSNRGRQPVCRRIQERLERDTSEIDAYFIERYRSDDYLILELRDRSRH